MQVFDPFHTPVSVETPAAFQHDKMSVVSMDVLQSLNPTRNQISSKELIKITLHSNDVSISVSDPSYTDKNHYKSSILHNNELMVVNQSSMKASTKNCDSEEQVSVGINGPKSKAQCLMTTCSASISDCESPTLSESKHLAEISLDDSAMGSDDFSIHTPISTHVSLPEPSYCHLDSRFVKHYWNFCPQKVVQKEGLIDLDGNDPGLEDCMTLDDLSNGFEQHIHTVIHLHSPDSENNEFPSYAQSEENMKPALSRKDLDNEEKVTDPPVMPPGDASEDLSEEKANTPCSSSEYIQSHTATNKSWLNVKPLLTHNGDHFEDDITLDLTAEDDCLSERGMDKSVDVQGSSEYFPPFHFTFMDELTCQKPHSQSDDIINSDMKCNGGYLPDDSLHTSCSLTGRLHCHSTDAMTMPDHSSIEVDDILNISPTEGCKPDSRCSSNESGYYGYVPSFDLKSFNGNALKSTVTDFNILPLDDI